MSVESTLVLQLGSVSGVRRGNQDGDSDAWRSLLMTDDYRPLSVVGAQEP